MKAQACVVFVPNANVISSSLRSSIDLTSSVEDGSLGLGEVLREALVLVGDLERELAGVAQHEYSDLVLCWCELVEGGKDKDSSLSHSRLGLADHVHAEDGLGNALVLDLGGVLETAVDDSAEGLGLKDEILETRGVDSNVVALLGVLGGISLVESGLLVLLKGAEGGRKGLGVLRKEVARLESVGGCFCEGEKD